MMCIRDECVPPAAAGLRLESRRRWRATVRARYHSNQRAKAKPRTRMPTGPKVGRASGACLIFPQGPHPIPRPRVTGRARERPMSDSESPAASRRVEVHGPAGPGHEGPDSNLTWDTDPELEAGPGVQVLLISSASLGVAGRLQVAHCRAAQRGPAVPSLGSSCRGDLAAGEVGHMARAVTLRAPPMSGW